MGSRNGYHADKRTRPRNQEMKCKLRMCAKFVGINCPKCGRPVFKSDDRPETQPPIDHGISDFQENKNT